MNVNCCEILDENMYLGEERWLTYKIVSCSPEQQDYAIQNATYVIAGFGENGGDVSGSCIVDDEKKTIKIKVKPHKSGVYIVCFTAIIADETIVLKVRLSVC